MGGSGRQSACKLATFMADYSLFQIEISKNYTSTEWREDLKKLLFRAGAEGKKTTFLFSDNQIKVRRRREWSHGREISRYGHILIG